MNKLDKLAIILMISPLYIQLSSENELLGVISFGVWFIGTALFLFNDTK